MARKPRNEWFYKIDATPGSAPIAGSGMGPVSGRPRCWQPQVDLIENDDAFHLKAEVAGVPPERIEVLYLPDRHSILVRGVREELDANIGHRTGIHQLEIYYGDFDREVVLPNSPIEPEAISAECAHGILCVRIPKARQPIAYRRITVLKV